MSYHVGEWSPDLRIKLHEITHDIYRNYTVIPPQNFSFHDFAKAMCHDTGETTSFHIAGVALGDRFSSTRCWR